ncbi:hypothetical protein T484DRAFT_1805053 [Baffinella frigidus]|nr:hypothetical protein T484DRAFT_1805053 [Cryptophyta sp. CCMP2293]
MNAEVRVIFMTSAFILEPTLYGTELMDATRQDYYDLRRIIRVWIPVKKTAEESSHELCVSVLDPWAFYDATALGFGRHNIQTLRFVFPTASICAKSLGLFTAMAMEAARKRSLQRGMQSSRFNNDNPHLEPVLEEAVERGGARTFAPNQIIIIVGVNSDAHGNLYHVVRGSALVTSEDVPPKVLWTVVAGQMYGENQFLSGAHTGFFTVRAGDQGARSAHLVFSRPPIYCFTPI